MDPEAAIRIVPSSSMPIRLEFVLDKEREGVSEKGKANLLCFPLARLVEVQEMTREEAMIEAVPSK